MSTAMDEYGSSDESACQLTACSIAWPSRAHASAKAAKRPAYAVDEGVAGIAVSVAFASDGGDRAVVRGTVRVLRAGRCPLARARGNTNNSRWRCRSPVVITCRCHDDDAVPDSLRT